MAKILRTRDMVLEKDQIKSNLAKIAANSTITNHSSNKTYPIPRLKENCEYIYLVYSLLCDHLKMNITIHPAGEWILDNYYIIEEVSKSISKELTKERYKKFPGLKESGYARVYVIANEIISTTDANISIEELIEYLEAYQTQKYLTMKEVWNIGLFLQICIIEKIRVVCEKIFISQVQKYKAQNIVERIIENKPKKKNNVLVEGKYSFIEYMSYKLKKYGKKSVPYLNTLEEEVNKAGMTMSEVINREHFDIAIKTLSMKNCITSLKKISRFDITKVFKKINIVEKILNQDPAKIYSKMDYKTKEYYRNKILELANKTKLSEKYISEQIIEICSNKKELKERHVGYYLIDEGKEELLKRILNKKVHLVSYERKAKNYIITIYIFTILICLELMKPLKGYALLLFVPIQNAVTQIIQYILSKTKKTRLIPKLDFSNGIPEDSATMCIIPTILKDKEDVKRIFSKMEIYYLANKSRNLFFTLLGDCTSSKKEKDEKDNEIKREGIKITQELNKKYGDIFFFIYRKREWSRGEKCFMGWERKRGLIYQYNDFLKSGKSNFLVNTCKKIPKIKYIITLDSDTTLTLNSAFELVGAMSHILNKPEVDNIRNLVTKGHGIIQPRIGVNISDGRKTVFSRLFAGNGGTDLYANAISDVYQDNFDEGIFTGKGIYDLDVFYKVLKDRIPENTVLSHDLLEGNYLRCGLASDIVLMDGYPSKYNSYKVRINRWIRGDIQIIGWIKSNLNVLSKYKIIDNIVRNMNEKYIFISLIIFLLTIKKYFTIPILLYMVPTILKLLDNLINQKGGTTRHKLFVSTFSKWTHTVYKSLVKLALIPDLAFLQINATLKALYRMKISHNNMLEWTTAEEAEKKAPNNIGSYSKEMMGHNITVLFLVLYTTININKFNVYNRIILTLLIIFWGIATILIWTLSKNKENKSKINTYEIEFLLNIAKKTWNYFKENIVNGLPVDNYQEDRREKKAYRTSPTNIGLAMLSMISSYDLGIESLNDTIYLLGKTIDTVEKLQKWNGHLYNWYDIKTLEPLHPYDISSVDNGNFIGYLYTIKQFLIENNISDEVKHMLNTIDNLINDTDFTKLYNYENDLFSVGFSIDQGKLYESYYDLLASEARQTSLVAIAKNDIPEKHWKNLGRTLTRLRNHKGLVSWGGTAFEYLMPNINIPTYQSTIIDESCKLLILSDKEYAQKLNIPWGMSESAYSLKDFQGNYQYKTFGIPWLGLKRGLDEDIVVSPYSSALALSISPKESINNLKRLEREGLLGKYGFYDAIDYKPKKEIVKTYMAHHQGMILASINNVINKNVFQKRFMKNPEIQGIKILLQENMPEDVIITKEKKTKATKIKYSGYEKSEPRTKGVNIISSGSLSNMISDKGEGFTKIENILVNKEVNIYLKNINTNKIYDFNNIIRNNELYAENIFKPYESITKMEDGNIKTTVTTVIAPNRCVEVRKIKIENKGINKTNIELTTYTEPILENEKDYNSHPAFNKMFLRYEYYQQKLILTRMKRNLYEKTPYLVTTLFGDDKNIDFEIDKERFILRGNNGIPDAVEKSKQFSNKVETVINPIVALKKRISIDPGKIKEVYLISSINYDKSQAIEDLKELTNFKNLDRVFQLSKEQTEAEIRYMGITEENVSTYQKMAKFLLDSKQKAYMRIYKEKQALTKNDLSNNRLWKYGISGEYPLIVVKLKSMYDYDIVQEVFRAYEYLVSKNIKMELVIITDSDIKKQIISDKMGKYINKREGIFVLDNIKYDESNMIEERSNLLIDSGNGELSVQINELEKEINPIKKEDKNVYEYKKGKTIKNTLISTKYKSLEYENGYGSYNNDGNEYWIKQSKMNRTPVAWSNIMANKIFGTVITENLGGYTWFINSQTNKITKFSNDAYMDESSERIIVKGHENNNDDYYAGFGLGYTHFVKQVNNLEQETTIFIPTDNSIKISILRLKNKGNEEKKLDIQYKVDLLMAQNDENSIIIEKYKESFNMIIADNLMNNKYIAYITSSEKIDENKEIHIKLMPKEEKEIIFIIGTQKTEMECIEVSTKYLNSYLKEFEKTKNYWKEKVTRIKSKTPLKSFDILQNGYLVYQTIVSRMYGRTGFYQSSGGYGYRDQLQDAIGMKWVDPAILENQILLHARHQFSEGDVEHWWHEDTQLGIRTRYSDDLLWLVYAVEEYIDFTGDYSILDKKEKYIKADKLQKNELDRVDYYNKYENENTIFDHCYRAIKKSTKLGKHNLPLMKNGDWNDGMNKIGEKGIGESVWLGFFLYDVLNRFIDIVDYKQKNTHNQIISKEIEVEINEHGNKELQPTNIQDYNKINFEELKEIIQNLMNKLKNALNNIAWDGRWYIRAIDDFENKIGSEINDECKIDSISQSFAVISNAGDNDKKYIAMSSLENYLIDNEKDLVKLLTPALEKVDLGYISSYAKGMRENGGQYTHAAIWAMIAETMLNKPDEAMSIYKKINPIEHTKSKEGILKYKVEPYVIEADIYSEGNIAGRGGWTWYTGSSSWLYEAQIKYILGIKIHHGVLTIRPCVPKDWQRFDVEFLWKEAYYHIRYNQVGNYKISIEDNEYGLKTNEKDEIVLKDSGEYEILVYF